MTNPPPPVVVASTGGTLRLGRELGSGGEGSVFDIPTLPNQVAKLYHRPPSSEKGKKLEGMARRANPELTRVAAWPVATLHHQPSSPVIGLTMPKVAGFHEVHFLYGPSHRYHTFPQADWAFLIWTARNVAAAFETLHGAGVVIGDVNQGNVLVGKDATVRLIDCDSFQFNVGDAWYACEVGVAHFTPPELQGRSFRGICRTTNHDSFGLAVLIFHLLFMGRHPFAGRFHGRGDMPLERAIAEHRFAFAHFAASQHMTPPPHSLQLSAASFPIAGLFERAFASGSHPRPTPTEWRTALDQLRGELKTCSKNRGHRYHQALTSCPWCVIAQGGGPDYFYVLSPVGSVGSNFNIAAVLAEAAKTAIPRNAPPAIRGTPRTIVGTPVSRAARIAAKFVPLFAISALLLGVVTMTYASLPAFFLTVILSILAMHGGGMRRIRRERAKAQEAAQNAYRVAASKWADVLSQGTRTWTTIHSDFQAVARAYNGLEGERRQAIRHAQEERFLSGHFLETANLNGFGAGRLAILASYGIETAADVSEGSIGMVPGVGPVLGGTLLAWKAQIEQKFRYAPEEPLSAVDRQRLEHRMSLRRQELEKKLRDYLNRLRAARQRTDGDLRSLTALLESLEKKVWQARTDLQAAS